MTQRTAEPTHPDTDDAPDLVAVAEPAATTIRVATTRTTSDPPYLPGYYLG